MEKQQSAAGVTPIALAILLCDNVITDKDTKKKTIVGIFSRIFGPNFPIYHSFTIYMRLIDAEGNYNFRVEYVQMKTDKILVKGEISGIKVHDRLEIVEIILKPPPIKIPQPGKYEFRIWANNKYMGRVSFLAEKKSMKGV